ncbi:MAG: hypothetical protein MK193_07265 [Lentisphaeria bacterium]|nr:hypothetical protein [Lentisphaeria bacterium]
MSSQRKILKMRKRRGQAIAEMIVGIIALMVMFLGLTQIFMASYTSYDALTDVRAEAELAIQSSSGSISTDQVKSWDVGNDELKNTLDDDKRMGVSALNTFSNELNSHDGSQSMDSLFSGYGITSYNEFEDDLISNQASVAAGLHRATKNESVEIDPILRSFLNISPKRMSIDKEIYMPYLEIREP